MKIKVIENIYRKFTKIQPWIADTILLLARLPIGWSFFVAGKGKLENLGGVTSYFESLGIPAPGFQAALVGSVEMIGGLFLAAGLMSRITALPLVGTMVVAYLTAHRDTAFVSLDAFAEEAPYAYLVVALVVLAFGPGRASLDAILSSILCKGRSCCLEPKPERINPGN